jgi:4-amino-4-deoxy-L-arabinose transferase-like glycosyltransferase
MSGSRAWSVGAVLVILVYLHNTVPMLTTLPRINVDEPWLIERAYQLVTTGEPSQPMFLLNHAYLLQPGHSLLLAPWIQLFGVGLLESRLLAVVCGLGALIGVYALARQLFGAAAGLVAAMFMATDSNFLGIARMARTDAPSTMFVALALAAALYGLRTSRSRWAFAGGVATGMAMLCHANAYWVGLIVFFWYLASFGWRLVLVPSAYGYGAGLAASFGPYAAVIASYWNEFNAQLQMFAIERVPGFSLATLWLHISHEPARYRDWYFGLITNHLTNPVLWLFQACTVAGAVYLAWRVWRDRRTGVPGRADVLAAILLFGSVAIFAAFIPNKALVYLPHLLVGFAVAGGAVVARVLSSIPVPRMPAAAAFVAPAVVIFALTQAGGAISLYEQWYGLMRTTELRPYEETHAIVDALVPPGPKYLIASPTFWLPFHNRPEIKFVAYTAAGPFDTVEPQGFFTRQRIFDFQRDRPFFLLVDEVEWRAVIEDPAYDPYWRATWIEYIRSACAPIRVVYGTAHGTLALFRCWDDRRARSVATQFLFEGRTYSLDGVAWAATADQLAGWQRYRPDTQLARADGHLRITGRHGGGIYADLPVTPNATYLLKVNVDDVSASDLLSIHEVDGAGRPVRSRWARLSDSDWFPSGTVIRSPASSVRVYLYSDGPTDFSVTSVELHRLAGGGE